MSLAPGARIGPFEVVASLGAGGMGEVYRARDTRLNRTVALKALLASVAGDAERIARFEREAQLLASLNHPNIAAIHGLEESNGSKYLVLEFVEGRTLADTLREGPMPSAEATTIARQIADALAAAHEKGIIHRDLKPGNVMVTPNGVVKVLDFGLGKSIDHEPVADRSNSPTLTLAATQQGVILGTAGYMSPEQAKGRGADRRSDVWALGCVLFEMITGRRAFEGEDVTDTIAAIVRGEPDWKAWPNTAPPALRALVERCLVKDRQQRLADMSVVRYILGEASGQAPITDASQASVVAAATAPPSSDRRAARIGPVAAAAIALAAALITAAVMWIGRPSAPAAAAGTVSRTTIPLPDGDHFNSANLFPLAISPDGSTIVYPAVRAGKIQLFRRSLSDHDPVVIEGTEAATMPFFSPDGEWIAFFAQGQLKKVARSGAGLQVIADGVPDARGGAWATDDVIYFAPTNVSGILRVSAAGGTPTQFTTPDRAKGEISHRWPHVLPDGSRVVFTIWTGPGSDERTIVVQNIASGERYALVPGGDGARFAGGHLFYGRQDALYAVPWQPSANNLGGAVPRAMRDFARQENEGAPAYAVSSNGTLVCLRGGLDRYAHRVVWVDRTGRLEPLPIPHRNFETVALAPDGKRAVLQVMEGVAGLWMYDFARNTLTPFATTGGSSQAPVWTPDSARVIYRGTRNGLRNMYVKAADGTGTEERLTTKEDVTQTPTGMSPDGRWLVYYEGGQLSVGGGDIYALELAGDRTPRAIVQTTGRDWGGVVSPDGRWLAYASTVSGRLEVYVQPFPGPGPRQPISTDGGWEAAWSSDGKELFYANANSSQLLAVSVTTGASFAAGTPRLLYEGRYRPNSNGNTPFSVASDGRALRVQQVHQDQSLTRIEVVLNWFNELAGAR